MSFAEESIPDTVDVLAYDFLARRRRGEPVSAEEYATAHPNLAYQIRQLFPTLVALEHVGDKLAPPSIDEPPERLGDFRILRTVGRGGMGVVYEAVQEPLGRHVALKVLPAGPRTAATILERFQREARTASRWRTR